MHATTLLALIAGVLFTTAGTARAQTNPCGNFDFTSGIDCSIEVEGGCTANCEPLKFEAACTGECTFEAEQMCVDTCGEQCVATCNPELLDCFAGCHGECDIPTQSQCEEESPEEDCESVAIAQCDIHCTEACEVPPNDCQEHCTRCCTGSCTTSVNFDCNLSCFAELSGGCEAQCDAPSGAIFCNGQYVGASDVEACIRHLATMGIEVDVSARGKVTCGLDGCDGEGSSEGCSQAGVGSAAAAILVILFAGLLRRRWT